jgi:hypothetical protein
MKRTDFTGRTDHPRPKFLAPAGILSRGSSTGDGLYLISAEFSGCRPLVLTLICETGRGVDTDRSCHTCENDICYRSCFEQLVKIGTRESVQTALPGHLDYSFTEAAQFRNRLRALRPGSKRSDFFYCLEDSNRFYEFTIVRREDYRRCCDQDWELGQPSRLVSWC